MKDTKTTAAARPTGLAAAAIAATFAVALLLQGGAAFQAAAEPGPEALNDTADAARTGADAAGGRLHALQAEYDAVLAEYGFRFVEPDDLSEDQWAEMDKRLRALGSVYERRMAQILPDAGAGTPGHAPSAGQLAKIDALQARMAAEADAIMREYGFDIATPDLSEEEEARMNARLAAIAAKMDALYGAPAREAEAAPEQGGGNATAGANDTAGSATTAGRGPAAEARVSAGANATAGANVSAGANATAVTGGAWAHGPDSDPELEAFAAKMDALQAEYDAVLAEYGFRFDAPSLTDEKLAEMEERLAALTTKYDRQLAQILPDLETLAPDFVPTAGQLAKLDELQARMEAEADAIMREYGFDIATPDLSEEEEARMNARLAAIAAKMDALYEAPAREAEAAPEQGGGNATARAGPSAEEQVAAGANATAGAGAAAEANATASIGAHGSGADPEQGPAPGAEALQPEYDAAEYGQAFTTPAPAGHGAPTGEPPGPPNAAGAPPAGGQYAMGDEQYAMGDEQYAMGDEQYAPPAGGQYAPPAGGQYAPPADGQRGPADEQDVPADGEYDQYDPADEQYYGTTAQIGQGDE